MSIDWTISENIDTAFYTMKDLDELAASIPEHARPALLSGLSTTFELKPPQDTSDKSLRQIFVFARMKLDTFADQDGPRSSFVKFVSRAFGIDNRTELAGDQGGIGSHPDEPDLKDMPALKQAPVAINPGARNVIARPLLKVAPAVEDAPAARPASLRDGRVRILDAGDEIFWISRETAEPHQPLDSTFAGALLPRPPLSESRLLSKWIGGQPWTSATLTIAFPANPANAERIVEEEAEMSQSRENYLKRSGSIEVSKPDPHMAEWNPIGNAKWLTEHGGSDVSHEAIRQFAFALGDAIGIFSDEKYDLLSRSGAHLILGEDAAKMISACARLEAEFLDDMQDTCDRDEQNIIGNLRPQSRIDQGIAMRRAAFMHVATGMDLADALVEGLADLRLAQAMRLAEDNFGEDGAREAFLRFNAVFFEDCHAPLDSYNIAKNSMELTF